VRVRSLIPSVAGLSLAALLLVGCAGSAAPTAAPATAPASTATAAPAIPSPTLAAPTATTSASTSKPGESLLSTVTTVTPTAAAVGESLKPATATPGLKPAATPPVQGRDSLKPVETPKPVQPTAAPAGNTGGKIKPVTRLQTQPTPAAPARKGVANANVDPQKYLTELVADLQQLADAVTGLGEITNAYESGQATEDQVVAGFQKQAGVVRAVYQREVQRDYPPQLKEIDDYFVESLRSASRMVDSLVMALQTGDQKYVTEAEGHAQKFEFFANELVKRLQ
jgi:hypothetical protein